MLYIELTCFRVACEFERRNVVQLLPEYGAGVKQRWRRCLD